MREKTEAENRPGLAARAWRCLIQEGPVSSWQRARMYVYRRLAERAFIRGLEMTEAEKRAQRETAFPRRIRFSILVPLYNTPEAFLREMIASVREQTYGNWELCLADGSDEAHGYVGEVCREIAEADPRIRYRKLERNGGISENTNACIDMAGGEYIALFDHDDLLHPAALYENMRVICGQGADFLYSDELVFLSPDKNRAIGIHLKPDYAPDDLLGNNYICHLTVFRRALLEKAGRFRPAYDGSQDHDLILRLTDCAEKIVHIPKVLYYWRSHPASVAGDIGSKTYAVDAGRNAVKDFLKTRKGIAAEVTSVPAYPTLYRIETPVRRETAVTVITERGGIPEKDAGADWERTIRERTDWPRVQWLSAGESGAASRAARLNAAAGKAEGEVLVFLEAGLTPDGADWIRALLQYAQREDMGAVTGLLRLRHRRNFVRSAGVILGWGAHGAAGRIHFGKTREGGGYFGQLAIAEDVTAVTWECLMIRKELFERLGGFDEGYTDCLLDADLCLRLRQEGLLNVYTPFAEMRGGLKKRYRQELGAECPGYERDLERFREKWQNEMERGDPYYHPNLETVLTDYQVRR